MSGDNGRKRVFGLPWWAWLPVLGFAVFAWGIPWACSHKGSSRPGGAARERAVELILRYEDEHGQFPESWDTIATAYPDDLDYDYPTHCENHPWERTKTGRLDQVLLLHIVPSDHEGHEQYEFFLYGKDRPSIPLYVKR